jgi:hypothetical protein
VSTVRWNLKEAGGKIPTRGTRTSSGVLSQGEAAKQVETQKLSRCGTVNDAGTWNESESSYRGRSHGQVETEYETWLKQDLS